MITKQEYEKRLQPWLDALRSGKYQQGFGCLRTLDNRFCCLGVACDVYNPDKWEQTDKHHYTSYLYNRQEYHLPSEVMEYFGIKTSEGNYDDDYDTKNLANDNDENDCNFNQIADIIEKNKETLFIWGNW